MPDDPVEHFDRAPDSPPATIRLSKWLSDHGHCSRREAEHWIDRGWVSVDGRVITIQGFKVTDDQSIVISPLARKSQEKAVTVLLNKPVGYVSGQPEDGYRPAIELVTAENRFTGDHCTRSFHPAQLSGMAPAGRLDIDSEGLLVLTRDGRIARRLIGKDSPVEKEYLVRAAGNITPAILEQLREGLALDGRPLQPARVALLRPQVIQIVLIEGRKRQIRRMLELVGLRAMQLKRVRIGRIVLGPLPTGQWRYLRDDERF